MYDTDEVAYVPRLPLVVAPPAPSRDLIHALAWYTREVVGIERLLSRVTVKRKRNPARPIRRRRSAFRDPLICLDFLAMAWLGATRLSQIAPYLAPRRGLARAFGLDHFCDHTTAHNFLNGFHQTHVSQLDRANRRLLQLHGTSPTLRAPILDVDATERRVRRTGRRRNLTYRWAVAFCAGEALAQSLAHQPRPWHDAALEAIDDARRRLGRKPRLVRLAGICASSQLFRALARRRLPFLAAVTWPWALAHRPAPRPLAEWVPLDDEGRMLDLGPAEADVESKGTPRTILVQRRAPTPELRRERVAIVTSVQDADAAALVRLSASHTAMRRFFGHARWPLGDGKMPSSDPRGNAAYLHLAAIATNVLQLFARHMGGGWTVDRLRAHLRVVPEGARGGPTMHSRLHAALPRVARP